MLWNAALQQHHCWHDMESAEDDSMPETLARTAVAALFRAAGRHEQIWLQS